MGSGHDQLDGITGARLLTGAVVQDGHTDSEEEVPGAEALLARVNEPLMAALPWEANTIVSVAGLEAPASMGSVATVSAPPRTMAVR
jgi:hypothetical protein